MVALILLAFVLWSWMLIAVCFSDIKQRMIRNKLVYLMALASAVLTCVAITNKNYPMGWWLIIQPLSVLFVGFGLFALGICGAGDAKLMTALSIVIHPNLWWQTLWLIAVIGGVLAIGYLCYGWFSNNLAAVRTNGLPYGVAISSGVFSSVLMSAINTELFSG